MSTSLTIEKEKLTTAIEVLGRTRHNWFRMGVLCSNDLEWVCRMLTNICNDNLNFKHGDQTDVDQMKGNQ